MHYNDHPAPHLHAEYQGKKALLDFRGNILCGNLGSRTAIRLVREWIDLRATELQQDWDLARAGRDLQKIEPLE